MATSRKIEQIFSNPARLHTTLESFINSEYQSPEHGFVEEDYPAVLQKLATHLRRPDRCDPSLYALITRAISKLMDGYTGNADWLCIQNAMFYVLNTDRHNEFALRFALDTLSEMQDIKIAFLQVLDFGLTYHWPRSIKLRGLHILKTVIDVLKLEEASVFVTATTHFVGLLIGLVLADYGGVYWNAATECLYTLVSEYVKTPVGEDQIINNIGVTTFSHFLRNPNPNVVKLVVPLLCTVAESSLRLAEQLILFQLPSQIQMMRVISWRDVADTDYVLSIFNSLMPRCTSFTSHQYLYLVSALVECLMCLECFSPYVFGEVTNGFDAIIRLSETASNEVMEIVFQHTSLVRFIFSHLMFAPDEPSARKLYDTLVPLCTNHPNLMTERIFTQGGIYCLTSVSKLFPNLATQVSDSVVVLSGDTEKNLESFNSMLAQNAQNLRNELEKADISRNIHNTVLEIMKKIHQRERNGNAFTPWEFLASGLAEELLSYFCIPYESTNKRPQSNIIFAETSNKVEKLHERFRALYWFSINSGYDLEELIKSLAKLIVGALISLDTMRGPFRERGDGAPVHRCTKYSDFTDTLPCILSKQDNRHDYYLLLTILNEAARLFPKLQAEIAAQNVNPTSPRPDVFIEYSALKQFNVNKLPVEDCFVGVVQGIKKMTDRKNAEFYKRFVMACPFVYSFDVKKIFLDVSLVLGNIIWDKQIHDQVVAKDALLETAKSALRAHSWRDYRVYQLQVKFNGETGIGRGPTSEFYTLVSESFESQPDMWCGDLDNGGLFPMPYPKDFDTGKLLKSLENFWFLGRLMANALCDGYLLNIHLSHAFYKLAFQDQQLSFYDINSINPTHGSFLVELKAALRNSKAKRLRIGGSSRNFAVKFKGVKRTKIGVDTTDRPFIIKYRGSPIEESNTQYDVPGSSHYKLTEDTDKYVTSENLECYLKDVHDAMVVSGVSQQINAFREGFGGLLPSLRCLYPEEIQLLLCGEERKHLPREELSEGIDFGFIDPTTEEEASNFKEWVIDIISGFDSHDTTKFMVFVTASKRVPNGGLSQLVPRMQVIVGQAEFSGLDSLPKAATCFNRLKMPKYPSREVVKSKLLRAMGEDSFALL